MVFQAVLICLFLAQVPDAVYIDYTSRVTLHSDFTFTETTGMKVIPLNGRGVARFSSISVSYRENMESLDVLDAGVGHWRGGRGHSTAEVSTGPHPVLSATNRMESSLREMEIRMPGVEVGDTVSLTINRNIRELPLSGVYSYSFSPVLKDSVASSSFTVVNDRGESIYATHSGTEFVFSGVSPADEHPLAVKNDGRISIATGSPAELSAEAWESIDLPEYGECHLLDSIVDSQGRDPALLRSWVAENISYTGSDAGLWPGWSPRSPEETLLDRAGVCRDRTMLLVWLMRKAGFQAWPALMSTTGKAPPLVDARYFDHMVAVWRESPGDQWLILDPTPSGLPVSSGFSFGLRGCSYLPLVPWGEELQTVPVTLWNDTLHIRISGTLDVNSGLLTGELSAICYGVPLQLVAKLYHSSSPDHREEMFRRFLGARECSSVAFSGNTLTLHGSWQAPSAGGYLLLPGLREISHTGTRTGSMLLPQPPDSFRLDAPVTEILELRVSIDSIPLELPEPVNRDDYSCLVTCGNGELCLMESACITESSSHILETLFFRLASPQRTVRFQ